MKKWPLVTIHDLGGQIRSHPSNHLWDREKNICTSYQSLHLTSFGHKLKGCPSATSCDLRGRIWSHPPTHLWKPMNIFVLHYELLSGLGNNKWPFPAFNDLLWPLRSNLGTYSTTLHRSSHTRGSIFNTYSTGKIILYFLHVHEKYRDIRSSYIYWIEMCLVLCVTTCGQYQSMNSLRHSLN